MYTQLIIYKIRYEIIIRLRQFATPAAMSLLPQVFIDSADTDHSHMIERSEFPEFVYHMAVLDLNASSGLDTSKWPVQHPPQCVVDEEKGWR